MKATALLLLVTVCLCFNGLAQDQVFLNTNQSLVFTNPSFAGSNGGLRNQTTYGQFNNAFWSGYSFGNCLDAYIPKLKGGLAFGYAMNGDNFRTGNTMALSYAQHFWFNKKRVKIIPSLQLCYGDIVANVMFGSGRMRYLDIASGLLISGPNLFLGCYVSHLKNLGDASRYTKLPLFYIWYLSYNKAISGKALLQVSARVCAGNSSDGLQLNANLLFKKWLVAGIGISEIGMNLVYANFGYRHENFSIIALYGFPGRRLAFTSNNQLELMGTFNLRDKTNRQAITPFETW